MRYIKTYEKISLKRYAIVSTKNDSVHLIKIIDTYIGIDTKRCSGGGEEIFNDKVEAVSLYFSPFAGGKIYPGKPGSVNFDVKNVNIEYESDDYDDADERFKILIDAKKYNL